MMYFKVLALLEIASWFFLCYKSGWAKSMADIRIMWMYWLYS